MITFTLKDVYELLLLNKKEEITILALKNKQSKNEALEQLLREYINEYRVIVKLYYEVVRNE